MTFKHTDAAAEFIASAASRGTSPEIMAAIAAFAHDMSAAEYIWEVGLVDFDEDSKHAFIDTVTGDGARGAPEDFVWGAAGANWL